MAPTATTTPLRVSLVGAGRVGTAVAVLLAEAGHDVVGIASRSEPSRRRAAELLRAPAFDASSMPPSDLVLLGVPDDQIASAAALVAPRLGPGAAVCHFAGAWGIAPLEAALERGAGACALHPVQACPDVPSAIRRLPGSAWGVTCSDDGWSAWARALVERSLGGAVFEVAETDRALWHAAAVTTSNGIAALLAGGEAMLEAIGVSHPTEVLGPLAAGTIANARAGGGGARTLTGPVVRGEVATIARHVAALRERAPELLATYELAARSILAAAGWAGRAGSETEASVLELLEAP